MKKSVMLKRVFALSLCAAFCLSLNVGAAEKLAAGDKKEKSELLLNRIGISTVYDEDAYITRGDFTVLAIQATGCALIDGETSFKDVDEKQRAYINTAEKTGIVSLNDEALFYPDRIITTEEAAAILLRILGYGDIITGENSYPTEYVNRASKLRILENTALEKKLTGADAARMIFNMLDTKYVEEHFSTNSGKTTYTLSNQTYLYEKHGIVKKSGKVTSVYGTSLNGYQAAEKDEIAIDSVVYANAYYRGFGYYTYLGQEVEYYEKTDRDGTQIIYIKLKNTPDIVDFKDVTDVKGFDSSDSQADKNAPYVAYKKENGKSSKMYIKPDATILINGEKRISVTNSDFSGDSGKITFTDSDGDNVCDVVAVEYHKYYRVGYFDSVTGKMEVEKGKILLNTNDFKDENLIFISGDTEAGSEIVTEKSIIQVAATFIGENIDPTKNTVISVKSQSVKGTIDYIDDDDKIGIGGKSYRVLPSILAELKDRIGFSTTFFLGNDDLIVAYDDFYDTKALKYGYLVKTADSGAVSHKYEVLIYTQMEEMEAFEISDDFKFTGMYGGKYVVENKIKQDRFLSTVAPGQLIRYRSNTDGKIDLIETAYDHSAEDDYDGFDTNRFSLDWKKASAHIYQRNIDKIYKATNSTVYFYVSTSSTNAEDFAVGSYIEKGYTVEGVSVKVYNSDKYMYPEVVVVENYPASKVRLQDNCGSILLVTNKRMGINSDGDTVTQFDSFLGRNFNTHKGVDDDLAPINASHYNHPTDVTKFSEIQNGDILRVSTNPQSEVRRFIVIHDYDKTHTASSWNAYANDFPEQPHLASINYVRGKITAFVPGSHLKVDCDDEQYFMFSRKSLTYWEYDVTADKMSNPATELPRLTVGDYVWFLADGTDINTLVRYIKD